MKKPTGKSVGGRSQKKSIKKNNVRVISSRLTPKGVRQTLGKTIMRVAKNTAKGMLNKEYSLKAALAEAINAEHSVKIGREIISKIAGPITNTSSTNVDVPAVLENSVGRSDVQSVRKDEASKPAYRTNFETGKPTSKILLALGKQQGTRRDTVYDSKWTDFDSEANENFPRERLTNSHGFNLRTFAVLPHKASVSRTDVKRIVLTGLSNNTLGITPVNTEQRIIGSLMNTTSYIQILNQNRYFPIKFKIHVILKEQSFVRGEQDSSVTNLAADIYNNVLDPVLEDNEGEQTATPFYSSIPDYFLVDSRRLEGPVGQGEDSDKTTCCWEMLNSGSGLMSSPYFRENYKIVKTIQKTLEPGETWQFNHKHHYGGGIDMTQDFQQDSLGDRFQATAYNYIIESVGFPCEGTYNNLSSLGVVYRDPRIGTSPGFWFYEFRTELEYVQAAKSSNDITTGTTNFLGKLNPPVRPGMHIRVFENDVAGTLNTNKTRPFYKKVEDISGSFSNDFNAFWINVDTETRVTDGGASTTSDAGDREKAAYGNFL